MQCPLLVQLSTHINSAELKTMFSKSTLSFAKYEAHFTQSKYMAVAVDPGAQQFNGKVFFYKTEIEGYSCMAPMVALSKMGGFMMCPLSRLGDTDKWFMDYNTDPSKAAPHVMPDLQEIQIVSHPHICAYKLTFSVELLAAGDWWIKKTENAERLMALLSNDETDTEPNDGTPSAQREQSAAVPGADSCSSRGRQRIPKVVADAE
jgi:hypothetical protein